MLKRKKNLGERADTLPPPNTKPDRRHLRLIRVDDEHDDGAEILPDRRVYHCKPWTAWSVEVLMEHPYNPEYDGAFETAIRDNRECAIFSLTLKGSDFCPIQICIWEGGELEHDCHAPLIFRVHQRTKSITIKFLASVEVVPEGVAVTYKA